MATFPALKPNGRTLGLGNTPQLEYIAVSGVNVRFLQGTKRVDQLLTLTYNSISESDVYLIYDHYEVQQGTLLSFPLPEIIWSGYTTVPVSSVDYEWRYAGTFSVAPTVPGRFSLEVTLQSAIIYP
jgi:hypothetical protein